MSTTSVLTRWAAALALAGLALAGCTDDAPGEEPDGGRTVNPPPIDLEATGDSSGEPTDKATSPGPTADPSSSDVPGSLPAWLAPSTVTEESFGSGGDLLPVRLRVGDHDEFDRVVLEMTGDDAPGWRVRYVPEAIADGSGELLAVEGDAVLEVLASGTRYPDEGEEHYDGPMVLDGENGVEEVRYVGTFEGLTQLFIGVDDGPREFRVFTLAAPARLVIDVLED